MHYRPGYGERKQSIKNECDYSVYSWILADDCPIQLKTRSSLDELSHRAHQRKAIRRDLNKARFAGPEAGRTTLTSGRLPSMLPVQPLQYLR